MSIVPDSGSPANQCSDQVNVEFGGSAWANNGSLSYQTYSGEPVQFTRVPRYCDGISAWI